MKGRLIGKLYNSISSSQAGLSTLEILIALALMTSTVTAVILVVFGNQSVSADAHTHQEALYRAVEVLEEARAQSRKNFYSVNSTPPTVDDIYTKSTAVVDLSPCFKKVTAQITWQRETRPQFVALATFLSHPEAAFATGGDCADLPEPVAWTNPYTRSSLDFNPSGALGTDLDFLVVNGAPYVFLTSSAGSDTIPDFWPIDVTNHATPAFAMPGPNFGLNIGAGVNGLNAIDVARHNSSGHSYAYAASHRTTSPYEQLVVIDVTDPTASTIVAKRSLPGVGSSFPQGWSIYYFDNKVYIGTRETLGHEFHIYDVSNPTNPIWQGSKQINHNVMDIIVRKEILGATVKTIAYLASSVTSDTAPELVVLDVTNPMAPVDYGSYNAPGQLYATTLYALGNKLYLGRQRGTSAEPDFTVLDITDPAIPQPLGAQALGLNPNTEVTGIQVSGPLAFLTTTQITAGFQIWNISDPTNITSHAIYNFSEKTMGLEYQGDFIYTVNQSNKGFRILYDNSP